jgi:hypothetical protein
LQELLFQGPGDEGAGEKYPPEFTIR